MNYETFYTSLNNTLNATLPSNIHSTIFHAMKNNGRERIGLNISKENNNTSPTIYLEEFFEQYQQGKPMSEIISDILDIYQNVHIQYSWDMNRIHEYDYVKSHIVYKLIHHDKNEQLLECLPHIDYLDLAIIFLLIVDTDDHSFATTLITDKLLSIWKLDIDELFQTASYNTPKLLPPEFKPMAQVVCEMLGMNYEKTVDSYSNHMYILSNERRHFGAACMLYEQVLEDIGNQIGEDYYILPSSIHELIILPSSFSPNKSSLNEMIQEINETQLTQEEVLSEHAYLYSYQEHKLCM